MDRSSSKTYPNVLHKNIQKHECKTWTNSTTMTQINSPRVQNNTVYIYTTLILLLQVSHTYSMRSGYFTDDGYQTKQLISTQQLPDWKHQEEVIRKELLDMLGLHQQPQLQLGSSADKFKAAPKFMLDLYRQLEYDSENTEDSIRNLNVIHYNVSAPGMGREMGNADLIMSFENQVTSSGNGLDMLFDFAEVPVTESVSHAELRLYKYPVYTTEKHFKIELYENVDNMDNGINSSEPSVVASTTVSSEHAGWFDIEITSLVKRWLELPFSNTGLHVVVTDEHGQEVPLTTIGLTEASGPGDYQAFLVAFFKAPDAVHVRQKRSVNKEERKKNRSRAISLAEKQGDFLSYNKCHREALYIRFKDLGWQNWIIAPEGYAAFHCTGQCTFPLNSHMNATNHAIVQTLVSLMEPYKVPLPCCTPTKMSAISVLYYDKKYNVILKKYKNMVVKACGCH